MPSREEMIQQIRASRERERMIAEIRAARSPGAEEKPKTNAAQAGLEHYGNEALLGHLPQVQAFIGSVMGDPNAELDEKLRNEGFKIEQPENSYVAQRDQNLARLAQMEEEHPIASNIGKAVGLVALPGTAALKGVKGAAKTAKALTKTEKAIRYAKASGTGAAMGAAYNPGDTEGEIDPFQTEDRIHGAKVGAVLGPAALGVGEAVVGAGKWAAQKGANTFNKMAERSAFKALEPRRTNQVKALIESGKAREMGRTMLDEGIVSPGATLDDIAARAKELKSKAGGEMEGILREIAQFEQKGGDLASRRALAKRLRERFVPQGPGVEAVAGKQGTINKWAEMIDEFERAGDDAMSIDKLQALKQAYDKEINWNRPKINDVPESEQLYRAMYGELKEAAETQAEKVATKVSNATALPGPKSNGNPAVGSPSLSDRFKGAKKKYGNAASISDIAEESQGRELTKQFFGLTDNQTGVGSAIVGASTADDPEEALKRGAMGFFAGKAASRLNRKLSPQTVALASDRFAKVLQKHSNVLGRYTQPLLDSMRRSPKAFAATYTALLKDPEFRSRVQNLPALSETEQEPTRAPAKNIKHGQTEDGFIFYGGDPSDQKNWKKLNVKTPEGAQPWNKYRSNR